MFSYNTNAGEYALAFIAGFHLGIPLAICQTRKSIGWTEISKELSESFSNHPTLFEVVPVNYEPETNFPLGRPLTIRCFNFFGIFNLEQFLQDEGLSVPDDQYKLDSLVWVCPSGIVLVMGKVSFVRDDYINLNQLESIVEKHYAELTYIFTQVAEIIITLFPDKVLNLSFCCASDIRKCKNGINLRKKFLSCDKDDLSITNYSSAARCLKDNDEVRALYDDILVDVYYVCFLARKDEMKLCIDYRDTSIESSDPLYLLIIVIAYSSFVSLLWLQKQLGEQSRILQEGLAGILPLRREISSELKLFRIFCLQFINESSPISIRLTREYMICLEECWKQYRMHTLVDQVTDQLATLEKMFDWVEEINKEARNLKIGLAAVLLALISITAVATQLISTVDVNSQIGIKGRVILISIGAIIGILSTIGIYILPIPKWYTPSKIKKRYQKRSK